MKKATRRFQYLALHLLTLSAVMAAAPTNDLFANRTRVEGMRVEMVGSYVGASVEAGEPTSFGVDASVWWSWVAPASGLALLEAGFPPAGGAVCVTTATHVESVAVTEELVTTMPNEWKRYATFQAVAGKEYQIGAFGLAANAREIQLRLCITNAPIILEGPVTRTISPGGSALFTVAVAAGGSGKARIQWQFEGTDIPNETDPMLARTNATASMTGEYRAIVSQTDSVGNLTVRTSSVARLTVSLPQSPRLLLSEDPEEAGALLISVIGEPGRLYNFASARLLPEQWIRSVGFGNDCISFESPLRAPVDQKQLFYSVRVFEPSNPTCWLELQRIFFVKQRLAADLKKPKGAALVISLVHDRLGYVPECPEGSISYGAMDSFPTCNVALHHLGFDLRELP